MLQMHAASMTYTQRNQPGFILGHALWWDMKALKGTLCLSHHHAGVLQTTGLL